MAVGKTEKPRSIKFFEVLSTQALRFVFLFSTPRFPLRLG